MTPEQLQTLKTEIALPSYNGMGDVDVAEALNATGVQVDRSTLTGGEIASAVDGGELLSLTDVRQRYVMSLFACDSIVVTANFRDNLASLFPAQSETRANLLAIFKRDGSRAEELGLQRVTPSNVADARRL